MGGTAAHLHVRQELVPKKELVTMVVRCKLTPPPDGGEKGNTYTTTTCTKSVTVQKQDTLLPEEENHLATNDLTGFASKSVFLMNAFYSQHWVYLGQVSTLPTGSKPLYLVR